MPVEQDGVGPTATLDPLAAPTIHADRAARRLIAAKKQQIELGTRSDIAAIVTNNGGLTWQAQGRVARLHPVESDRVSQFDYSKNARPGTVRNFRVFAWDCSDLGVTGFSCDPSPTAGPVRMAWPSGQSCCEKLPGLCHRAQSQINLMLDQTRSVTVAALVTTVLRQPLVKISLSRCRWLSRAPKRPPT